MGIEEYSPTTGSLYESDYIAALEHAEWNGKKWIEHRKTGNKEAANKMLDEWALNNLGIEKEEWEKSLPEKRRKLLFNWVMNHQPENWDPNHPLLKSESGKTINTAVADVKVYMEDELDKNLENFNPEKLKIYSGRETPVDTFYGADLFVTYEDEDVGLINATIDLTNNPSKVEGNKHSKANYVLHFSDPENKIDKRIEEEGHASSIARIITRQIESRKIRRSA